MTDIPQDIAVEIDDMPYIGRFVVRGNTVVVTSEFGVRSAEITDAPPDTLARSLLRQMVKDHSSAT